MTATEETPRPPDPSIFGPVLFVAFAAAMVMSLPAVLGRPGPELFCFQNCCGGITVGFLGVMPVRMFSRQGLGLSPGLGFVIPFLGVFMGGVVGAIVQMAFGPLTGAEVRAVAGALYEDYVRRLEEAGQSTEDVSRADWVATVSVLGRYGVVLFAFGGAVLAGAVGFVVAGIARRMPPRGGPEEGDGPPSISGER